MDFYNSERQQATYDGWSEDSAGTADDHGLYHQAAKAKRTYDCTFCKRGFTNAQALGGHMNIHRRDRAKATNHLHNQYPLVPDDYAPPSPIAVPGRCNYPVLDHHVHHQASRNKQYVAGSRRSSTVGPGCLSSDHGDRWGANLSLGIGSGGRKEDRELDLELRLGHVEP